MTQQVFEGIWEEVREEIRALDSELAGHRVRLILEQSSESPKSNGMAQTLADRFAGRTGRINSGGSERLSGDTGEKFTQYLEIKHAERNL
jgi:hypothetical protein